MLPRRLVDWYAKRDISVPRLAVPGAPLALLLASEGAFHVGADAAGLTGHALVVLGSLWLLSQVEDWTDALTAVALLAALRLVSAAMPPFLPTPLGRTALVYAPFLPVVALGWWRRAGLIAVANRQVTLRALPAVVVSALVFAQLQFLAAPPEPLVPTLGPADLALATLVVVPVVALVEETLFRGLLQRSLGAELGPVAAVGATALVFGVMRAGDGPAAGVLVAVLLGVALGALYEVTEGLLPVVVLNGLATLLYVTYLALTGGFL